MNNREAFEAWYQKAYACFGQANFHLNSYGEYVDDDIEASWCAWQAALASQAQQPNYGLHELAQIIMSDCGISTTNNDQLYDRILGRLIASSELQSQAQQHSDDIAVDHFAAAMKAKLAKKREQGRGGWSNKEECSEEHLQGLLLGHVAKGDPVDVGNFAMMLFNRGERTQFPLEAQQTECKHRFALQDLRRVSDDEDSPERVSWACWKCGKEFKANCGLDIYKHGTADNSKGQS